MTLSQYSRIVDSLDRYGSCYKYDSLDMSKMMERFDVFESSRLIQEINKAVGDKEKVDAIYNRLKAI